MTANEIQTITGEAERTRAAAQLYLDRAARRDYAPGYFDKWGRWYPADDERQDCCDGIRAPSKCWPYTLLRHCRTQLHVATLCGVDRKALARAARDLRAEAMPK